MSTPPHTSRRRFLLGVAATGAGGLLTACGGGSGSGSNSREGPDSATTGTAGGTGSGLGELHRAGAELALPAEFQYVVLGQSGDSMRDGASTPFAFDGMASFELPNGNVRLIRNHEIREVPDGWALLGDEELAYDASAPGCTTSLEVRLTGDGEPVLVESFVSATGMLSNCAGGPTPWGSWLTCEETTEGRTRVDGGGGWDGSHGYAFEISADGDQQQSAVPLPALGRFVHEAAAVDPGDGTVYLTEDNGYDSGLYRFLPDVAEDLARGGRLEMLAIVDRPEHDTAYGNEQGACMSPDGTVLFVNTYGDPDDPAEVPSRTLAIWGPWERLT